ncbi:MAG: dephospho-CoA kinase [Deltaproteobacteria bacterium]|nr:dephospho-CoA kinase [Deltaproteobacteria bacterium]MBW2413047.1 dephospho-CoA kinase [Deltaproteobacteria bacterium]
MSGVRSVVIGLTGGIGTGKTRVSDLLRELGAAIVCSDEIVRQLQAPGGEVLERIRETFGDEYVLASGELDRARLGELVFNDPAERQRLNAVVHPAVGRETSRQLEAHRKAEVPVIVLDIPLLFEVRRPGTAAAHPTDFVVTVYAPAETQLERVLARDDLEPAEARARIDSQIPIEEKRELADVVIDNSGAWDATEKQVRELYALWVSRARSAPPG